MNFTAFFASLALALICTLLAQPTTAAVSQPTLEWVEQLTSSESNVYYSNDGSRSVSADGLGSVYISGFTTGSLDGTNAGSYDAFVRKYDADGIIQWTKQLGTSSSDQSYGVSADGLGNVYISGNTRGSLGGTNAGGTDGFVSKYDAVGSLLWTKQLGRSSADSVSSVSTDGLGNVYVSGFTSGSLGGRNAGYFDAFVSKYNASGARLWIKQWGTDNVDFSWGVSADGLGNVYISGDTGSNYSANGGDRDAFVGKYNRFGSHLWTKQLGTSSFDRSSGVSVDGLGNVFISGYTDGSLDGTNAGSYDAFVSKYDASGSLLWTEQLGTSSSDQSNGVSADGLGNVYISGTTRGSLGGTNAGERDAFVSKYDVEGSLLWTEQLGTDGTDISYGVSADGSGNVYISGYTSGNLGGTNAVSNDAFIAKYSEIPEPATLLLTAIATAGLSLRRRR